MEKQPLELERIQSLLNSKDKEFKIMGQMVLKAFIKDYYPTNYERLIQVEEKYTPEKFNETCKAELLEIAYLEGHRVDRNPLDNVKNTIDRLKSGGGWG